MKFLAIAASAAILSAAAMSSAAACGLRTLYSSQMKEGAYAMDLNGVRTQQNDEPGDYFNGGPFTQFLLEGENTFTLTMTQGSADVRVYRACRGDFEGETLVEAKVVAPESKSLTFFVENAPAQVYDDAPSDDSGLKEALAALRASVEAKDVDAYRDMHKGLIMTAMADGMPEDMLNRMIAITIEQGEASYNDDVTFKPAMEGRVWQVLTDSGESPIVIDIKMNGGTNTMRTGAYWAKLDGEWTIVSN